MATQYIEAGQCFRFKEDIVAVLFTNPFGGLQSWCIPADYRPYKSELYGEVITIPSGMVFAVRDAYEAILGGHCVQAEADFPDARGRYFTFFQFKQRREWEEKLDEKSSKFLKAEIEILP